MLRMKAAPAVHLVTLLIVERRGGKHTGEKAVNNLCLFVLPPDPEWTHSVSKCTSGQPRSAFLEHSFVHVAVVCSVSSAC
jgi:hypothetical protein